MVIGPHAAGTNLPGRNAGKRCRRSHSQKQHPDDDGRRNAAHKTTSYSRGPVTLCNRDRILRNGSGIQCCWPEFWNLAARHFAPPIRIFAPLLPCWRHTSSAQSHRSPRHCARIFGAIFVILRVRGLRIQCLSRNGSACMNAPRRRSRRAGTISSAPKEFSP